MLVAFKIDVQKMSKAAIDESRGCQTSVFPKIGI
jgi:hypothetical protein